MKPAVSTAVVVAKEARLCGEAENPALDCHLGRGLKRARRDGHDGRLSDHVHMWSK